MTKKILVATEKPFISDAVKGISNIINLEGYDLALLEKYNTPLEESDYLKNANALIVRSDKVTKSVIENAPNLELIVRAGAGYDNIDLKAANERDIKVMNTPGQNSNAVAELVIGMMIMAARNNYNASAGIELRKKPLGLHAYGYIGKAVASIGKGFGMKTYAYDPFVPKELISADGVFSVDNVEELYKNCNFVSLHIPENEHTLKCVDMSLLEKMPSPAILINTARKGIVCEDSLIQMFEERDDFKYYSDISPESKDLIAEKFPGRYFFTPKKMGAQTLEANINAGLAAANQIIGYYKGKDMSKFIVNL